MKNIARKNMPNGLSFKSIITLGISILVLIVLVLNFSRIVSFFSFAAPVAADIKIDALQTQGTLPIPWNALAQGGELDTNGKEIMPLGPTVGKLKLLKTKYVRIDHVFDLPSESRIREIVNMGAVPIISLSYFPKGVGTSDVGDIVSWEGWQNQVTALVEKVSGKKNWDIDGVYYEVWNEPDGESFGKYSIGEGKDYFTLYQKTTEAILRAKNVNSLKIGGPALADLRRCTNGLLFTCQRFWLDRFFELVSKNKTRIDFVSWHRYSLRMSDYKEDVNFINETYGKYPGLPSMEKLITEWGSVPQRDNMHDSYFDAVHLVAAARTFLGQVDLATKFEARNGPSAPNGGWGIMTYDGAPKPTYTALKYLAMLRETRTVVNGEGTYVSGIASRDNSGMTVILTNYDSTYKNFEKVPVVISNLPNGKYRLSKFVLDSQNPMGDALPVAVAQITDKIYSDQQTMTPNSIVVWDLQMIGN